MSVSLIVKYM